METEIWKDIPGYEGLYKVNQFGKVLSLPRRGTAKKILSVQKSRGYPSLKLCKDDKAIRYTVHKIVCMAFHDKPHGAECINHIDGNKENNYYKNLEYTTFKGNTNHAIEMGLFKPDKEFMRNMSKKRVGVLNHKSRAVIQIDSTTGCHIKTYETSTLASKETGAIRQHISKCCLGLRRTSGGFMWKYE